VNKDDHKLIGLPPVTCL